MIFRNSDAHFVISESKRKLSATKELLVLPSFIIVENTHARKPLCKGINVVAIVREIFITTAPVKNLAVILFVTPGHGKHKFFTLLQLGRKVYPHHRVINGIAKVPSRGIFYGEDVIAALVVRRIDSRY